MTCGAFAPASRLARLKAVPLVVVRAMLYVPFPVMSGVISTVVHTPLPKPPEVAVTPSMAGALVWLIVNSFPAAEADLCIGTRIRLVRTVTAASRR